MTRFNLGRVVMTRGINDDIAENAEFSKDVIKSLGRYAAADFSDMEHEEDIQMNNDAIKNNDNRILASYETCKGKIYIITEWDRSFTTILYPHEY